MTGLEVISGGQTGVDTAALLVAKAFSLPISGYVPLHYTNELGACSIPEEFRTYLTPTNTTDSAERTELNITKADGILILLSGEDGKNSASRGTQHGVEFARKLGKKEDQLCFVDMASPDMEAEVERVVTWIRNMKVRKCAIGGPRESEVPGIEDEATAFLLKVFEMLEKDCRSNV